MKIRFIGAACTATGSMHLVEAAGKRILLDCGLFQGRRQEAYEKNRSFPFRPADLSAVVLSHAHMDHAGNLPTLVKLGFRGDIYATPATRDLCAVMLTDSAHIQEKDAEFLRERSREFVAPLYGPDDVTETLRLMTSVPPGRAFRITDGLTATFHPAGHILGAAGVVLESRENGRTVRLGFSGDVGQAQDPLMGPAQPLPDIQALILESTYGGRRHPTMEDRKRLLMEVIRDTAARGGKVIVPAFSVGRTQLLVWLLNQLFNEKLLPPIPVYVDSPLSVNVTDVFRMHLDQLRPEVRTTLRNDPDPFGFARLTYIQSREASVALNRRTEPMVILSASGMCESGRVLHHLKNTIEDERNTILFVGYQAHHTLGSRLSEKAAEVRILGQTYHPRARIETLHGFSAHADGAELVSHAQACNPRGMLHRTYLVHGEEDGAAALKKDLEAAGVTPVFIPTPGEEAEI